MASGVGDGPVRPWMPWTNRPGVLLTFANCTNVSLREVTIRDAHNWTINFGQCRNVLVSAITVLNNPLIPNNDGLDISAENARISDCVIVAGDDAIAANRCKNLAVVNCTLFIAFVAAIRSAAIRTAFSKISSSAIRTAALPFMGPPTPPGSPTLSSKAVCSTAIGGAKLNPFTFP